MNPDRFKPSSIPHWGWGNGHAILPPMIVPLDQAHVI